ncbi:hypothetical protein [Sinorhizobium arboris]|uniref:Uncharacterized protein n=1 Tax=Sinorhizobium arboris TaxID=76745 RepID=D1CSI2_9HYPH|nr:hypothetical protein [Sinorhizobium arboris]ABD74786.1 hypothetical protein [Sinorhizobium arboris LMG 14919]
MNKAISFPTDAEAFSVGHQRQPFANSFFPMTRFGRERRAYGPQRPWIPRASISSAIGYRDDKWSAAIFSDGDNGFDEVRSSTRAADLLPKGSTVVKVDVLSHFT